MSCTSKQSCAAACVHDACVHRSAWRDGELIGVEISAPHDHRKPQALHAAGHELKQLRDNAQAVKATGE
jgi:hypothetical protein